MSSGSSSRPTRSRSRSPTSAPTSCFALRCRSASTGRPPRSSPISSRTACAAASATPDSRWPQISGAVRRPARRRRARRGRLPAEPDLQRTRRRRSAPTSPSGSACRRRSTATSISSRSPSTGSDRRAASTTSSSSTSSAASASASCTTANCSAAPTGSAPISATSWCARRATAADAWPTSPPRPRCSPKPRRCCATATTTSPCTPERAMALLLQRADAGDARCVRAARRGGRGARLRHRQSHHAVRAAQGHHLRDARWRASDHFIDAAARDGRGAAAAEPRRRLGHRRARMERRDLGARRRGDDAARSLRRAVGNDRSGADRERRRALRRIAMKSASASASSAAATSAPPI